jgi:hypothetical protein
VAAVFPISRPHAIAAGLRYKAVAIALAASAVTALIRLPAPAPGADPAQNLRLPSRFTGTFLRQPPITKVAAVALEGISGNTCVMALGESDKLSVGFGELSRETMRSHSPEIPTSGTIALESAYRTLTRRPSSPSDPRLRRARRSAPEQDQSRSSLTTLLYRRIQGKIEFAPQNRPAVLTIGVSNQTLATRSSGPANRGFRRLAGGQSG